MGLRSLSCGDVGEACPHEMQFFLLSRGKAEMVQVARELCDALSLPAAGREICDMQISTRWQ